MGSQVLPQALHMIARNSTQYPGQRRLSLAPLVTTRLSISRYSHLKLFAGAPAKRGFVVRAEAENVVPKEEEKEENASVAEDAEAEGDIKAQETEVKEPRKPRIKLGDIMGILNKRAVQASEKERPVPDIRTGDIVEIKLEVPENKRRLSIYKGIVMSRQNAGIHTTIRIRRIIAGIGVEIVFPLYSPNIKELKVVKHRKVRRARLYYLRDKLPRLSTFK
ncbi:Ribosomal_L19 domain-containing protein [Cephalotus follicularis]|uniref:Ribosomal_L19 domain-containing protein n=1 Tax=Cephalotus follicularis TaxID=3775 RepID=A0A1Q3BIK8_CEPFO|nr:Ribosomal_L19 domain-containing protein [Cephalotus follicularis]